MGSRLSETSPEEVTHFCHFCRLLCDLPAHLEPEPVVGLELDFNSKLLQVGSVHGPGGPALQGHAEAQAGGALLADNAKPAAVVRRIKARRRLLQC